MPLLLLLALAAPGCADGDATSNSTDVDEPSSPPVPFDPFERQPPIDHLRRLHSGDACAAGEYVVASTCQPWSTCPPGQYVESEPTRSLDRVCADCAAGTHSTRDNSPRCVPEAECAPGTQAVDAPGSLGVTCEDCPEGTWNDGTSPEACRTPSTCAAGLWVAEDFEATHDRRCEACSAGTYSSTPNASGCSVCAAGSYCPSGSSTPESCTGETWDDDGDPKTSCASFSDCPDGFREFEPGTSLTDRVCSPADWYHELGGHGLESAGQAVVDAAGDVYVQGDTYGDVDGNGSRGGSDLFVRKLSGAEGTEVWRAQLGSAEHDSGSIALDPSGALAVLGSCFGDLTGDVCLTRLSLSDGAELGTIQLGDLERPRAIAFNANGDIAVSGELGTHVFVRKMTAGGETLWEASLEESSEGGQGVAFDSAGNVAVSYWKTAPESGSYYRPAVGYVSTLSGDSGAPLWTSVFDFDHVNHPGEVLSDDAGRLVVGVHAHPDDDLGAHREHVALLESQSGTLVWSRDYDGDAPISVSASVAPNGDVFVQSGDRTLQRLAGQDGSELWRVNLETFTAMDVVSTPSGDAVFVGDNFGYHHVWTERVHGGDGSRQWRDTFTTSRRDYLYSVAVDLMGDVIVGGSSETSFERVPPNAREDALIRKLSGDTGVPIWTRQFGSDGADAAYALSVDSLGDVVVAGDVGMAFASDSLGEWDAFVSKLSGADGTTLWSTQFGSIYSDNVRAIAIDGLGDVFVTGQVEAGNQPEISQPKAYARKLSGLDGSVLWETTLGDGTDTGWQAPAVGVLPNGDALATWYIVDHLQQHWGIVRLSGVDGSVVWAMPIEGSVDCLAVDAAGDIALVVEVVYDGRLVKLSGEDGSELWSSDQEPAAIAFDPDGDLVLATPENIRRLSGVDGSVLTTNLPVIDEPVNAALAVSATGDIVLAGSIWVTDYDADGFVLKLSGERWR